MSRVARRFGICLLAVVMTSLLAVASLSVSAPEEACAATGTAVTVDATRAEAGKLVVKKGATYNLGVKSTKGAKVTYKSSKPKVVKLPGKGKVKALKTGKATVTITAKKGKAKATKKIAVTVVAAKKYKKVKSISVKVGATSLIVGKSVSLKTAFKPAKASNKNLIYKSSNTSVLAVSPTGKVTAKKAGTAKVTVTSADNGKAKRAISFSVKNAPAKTVGVTSITAKASKDTLTIGETASIAVTVSPANATNKKVTYKSSNASVLTVSPTGKVTAKKAGTAKVTVTSADNGKAKRAISFSVKNAPAKTVGVTSITAKASKGTLTIGETASIAVTVSPANATNKKVAYKSSNASVLSVDAAGKVTAKGAGTAKITVTSDDNPKVSASVKVGVLATKAATVDLGVLTADVPSAKAGVSETAVFEIEPIVDVSKYGGVISVYKDGAAIGTMNDKGAGADAVASDGIYTAQITCYSDSTGTENYLAKANNAESQPFSIRYFNGVSANEIDAKDSMLASIKAEEDKLTAVDSEATRDDLIDAAYAKALEGQKSGDVIQVAKEADGVLMQMSSGIWCVYQPEQEEVDANGLEAALAVGTMDASDISSSTAMSISTLQPSLDTYGSYDGSLSNEATDQAATKISQALTNYSFSRNLDNSNVTLNAVKQFGANQIILSHSHGYYSSNLGSMIWVGQKLTSADLRSGGAYEADAIAGRVVLSKNGYAGYTRAFVDKYVGNMNNSLVYLAACLSGKDSRLATSFLNKGARAVVANDETIWRVYNCRMMRDVINGLLQKDSTTGRYSTLRQALAYAKQQNGDNDFSYLRTSERGPATVRIFGNENFRLNDDVNIEVSAITLNKTSDNVGIGATTTLNATITPTNATNKSVTWTSSNNSIASVNNGVVTGVSQGNAVITARTSNGKTATCSITVNPIEATGLSLNMTSANLLIGGTVALTATVAPSNATDKTVTWSSSNTTVATVSGGTVTGRAAGTATITARTSNGKTATCVVTVSPIEATGVSLNRTSASLSVGGTVTLTATVSPSNATDKTVSWSTSNSAVATVSGGVVTARSTGSATITATTSNGKTATCAVTVAASIIDPTSVTLNRTSASVDVGATVALTATVAPSNATDKTVTWTSSNTTVATVSGGTVTGRAAGTATITARTSNGKTASCTVSVNQSAGTPFNGDQYWVVFTEGYRDGRVEAASFSVTSGAPRLVWNKGLSVVGATVAGSVKQYLLNDSGTWEQIGTYGVPTDWAIEVVASNMAIVNSGGTQVKRPTVIPGNSFNGDQYWVVFTEGYRDGRVEAASFSVTSGAPRLVWNKGLSVAGATVAGSVKQYLLNDSGTWEQIGTYGVPTDWAIEVVASNVPIFSSDGSQVKRPLLI